MGLLRLLLALFVPPRRSGRTTPAHDPPPVRPEHRPVRPSPWEPPRHEGVPAGRLIRKGRCWVIDGDTIVIENAHIRLAGIDAPELDQPYGQNAKRALMKLCHRQVVTAISDGSTSHDRLVAVCRLDDGRDLSAEMVRAGLALDWAKHSGGRYRHLEPRDARRRLWRVDARQKGRMPPGTRPEAPSRQGP